MHDPTVAGVYRGVRRQSVPLAAVALVNMIGNNSC